MDTKIKMIIYSNPNYKKYLRFHSYWYKTLNRNPNMINRFIDKVKEDYKLRTSDKITNFIDKVDMVSKLISVMR